MPIVWPLTRHMTRPQYIRLTPPYVSNVNTGFCASMHENVIICARSGVQVSTSCDLVSLLLNEAWKYKCRRSQAFYFSVSAHQHCYGDKQRWQTPTY